MNESIKVKIEGRNIGQGEKTFIIAEIGSNHDRNLEQAIKMIDIAKSSGVDAVKFQIFKAENFYSRKDPLYDIMKKNELPWEWLEGLHEYARKNKLIFLASPFDEESIALLCRIGVPAIKWASSETVNLPLLRYAALKKKLMLISTGMCNLADIYEAIEVVRSTGNRDMALLQNTSLYPTKPEEVNLFAMDTLKNAFKVPVGFSDHTLGYFIPLAAVARGACIIEKHFTLSRKLKGPDHFYAVEPNELGEMVRAIREIELSLGVYDKSMLPRERKVARRYSLIAKKDILRGSKITKDVIEVKRPALGIDPRFISAVLGTKAKKKISKGKSINWDEISDSI